ncbi:MAG: putative toluene tolerance transporter [Rhodospirillales bacterium]|nr:putative toluene tolerance transporter [Rhodospirillales bacterium]
MKSARHSLFGSLVAFTSAFAVPAILAASLPVAAQAQTSDAGQFVQDLGNKAIAQLAGKQIPEAEEQARFRNLLNQYFDVTAIGRFTAGRAAWAAATPEQQKEFLSLYETQVSNAYAKRFQDYSGETFKVTKQQKDSDSDTVVSSEITRPNGAPPVPVQWRVRAEGGTFKIADVVIAGISMAVTDQQQFSAVIQRGGGNIQALIDALRSQNMVVPSTKG